MESVAQLFDERERIHLNMILLNSVLMVFGLFSSVVLPSGIIVTLCLAIAALVITSAAISIATMITELSNVVVWSLNVRIACQSSPTLLEQEKDQTVNSNRNEQRDLDTSYIDDENRNARTEREA